MLHAPRTAMLLQRTLLLVASLSILSTLSTAQQKPAPAKKSAGTTKRATTPKSAASPAAPAPAAPVPVDGVLTNDSVVGMLKAGQTPEAVIERIKTSEARFEIDADHLVDLKAKNVPSGVIRAMLNKAPPPEKPAAPVIVPDPEPPVASPPAAPPGPPPIPANLESAIVRQGENSQPLSEHPQKVMFVKSDAASPNEAVATMLIMQVGLPLLTMGMSSQMGMWNPYMGETFAKAANLGKGLLRGRGSDTKGFEFDMLPGVSASLTLKEGTPEFLVPLNRYLTSANVDLAEWEPVLLRLETRDKDQARLLSSRQVLLKETKKGRFDMKPTVERQESKVQQTRIAANVQRAEGNTYSITPVEPLQAGEYALVFRKKSATGDYTTNVPLRVASPPPAENDPFGLSPSGEPGAPSKGGLGGLMGRRQGGQPPSNPLQPQQPEQQMTGFVAWDFRVMP